MQHSGSGPFFLVKDKCSEPFRQKEVHEEVHADGCAGGLPWSAGDFLNCRSPLHPLVISGFLKSTPTDAQILIRAFHFFPSHRICGAQQVSVIQPVLPTLCYKWLYRKDRLVSCPDVYLLPSCTYAVCNSASPCQVLSHQRSS